MDYKNVLNHRETAILTNFDMEELDDSVKRTEKHLAKKGGHIRSVTGKITVDPFLPPVYVTCCHLHYRTEPIRMGELGRILVNLKTLFEDNVCQIWTGDFNSLTRDDYDEAKWEDIAAVRSVASV